MNVSKPARSTDSAAIVTGWTLASTGVPSSRLMLTLSARRTTTSPSVR